MAYLDKIFSKVNQPGETSEPNTPAEEADYDARIAQAETDAEYEGNKAAGADAIRYYTEDIRQLGPALQSYILLGRAYALNDGQPDAVVFAIQDKADAQAYITGKPEWAALSAAEKQWWGEHLNSLALVLQAIIAFI